MKVFIKTIGVAAFYLLFQFNLTSVYAQRIDVPLRFVNSTPNGTSEFAFTVAAHPNGTDDVDTALNEIEIPPIPLPGSVFYVWTVAPVAETIWLSPFDIRKYTTGAPYRIDYDLRVNWNGGTLECEMPLQLPIEVDSVYIVDGFSDWPDSFVKVKLGNGSKFTTDNPALTNFRIMVWFNGKSTGVAQNVLMGSLDINPMPVAESMVINGVSASSDRIEVYYMNGGVALVANVTSILMQVPVNDLSPGMYLVKEMSGQNVISVSTIVKL